MPILGVCWSVQVELSTPAVGRIAHGHENELQVGPVERRGRTRESLGVTPRSRRAAPRPRSSQLTPWPRARIETGFSLFKRGDVHLPGSA